MPFVIQLVWNNKQFESYLRTASLQRAEEAAQISAGAPPPSPPAEALFKGSSSHHGRMQLPCAKDETSF